MTDQKTYEVRVSGLVPEETLHTLADIRVAASEMRTVLVGEFADQAALYGFLHRLRALGLEVVEVRRRVSGTESVPNPDARTEPPR